MDPKSSKINESGRNGGLGLNQFLAAAAKLIMKVNDAHECLYKGDCELIEHHSMT